MAEITKPIMLDETGKAIVNALMQNDIVTQKTAEISAAADIKLAEVLNSIPEDYTNLEGRVDKVEEHGFINDYYDFVSALTANPLVKRTFIGKEIIVSDTIDVSGTNLGAITFTDCTFNLDSDMFTWSDQFRSLPTFVNCTFIGNGHCIVSGKKYVNGVRFINCTFNECKFTAEATFVQSPKFILCRWSGTSDFMISNAVYDCVFSTCAWENDWQATLLKTVPDGLYKGSVQLRFDNCVIEGQTQKEFLHISSGGELSVKNCYIESVTKGFANFSDPNLPNPRLNIEFRNNKLSWTSNDFALINVSNDYPQAVALSRYKIVIDQCTFDTGGENQRVLSRLDLEGTEITRSMFLGSSTRFDFSDTKIRANSAKLRLWNGARTTLTIHKYPCLVSWLSYDGGNHSVVLLVDERDGTPIVTNLAGSSSPVTATYDNGDIILDTSNERPVHESTCSLLFLPKMYIEL